MDLSKFTDRARLVLKRAAGLAGKLGHPFVDYVHVLLGLAQDTMGVAGATLQRHGYHYERIMLVARTAEFVHYTMSPEPTDPEPRKPVIDEILARAHEASLCLGDKFIGTEHVLLGVLDYHLHVVSLPVLRDLEMNVTEFRRQVVETFHPPDPSLVSDQMCSSKLLSLHPQIVGMLCEYMDSKHEHNDRQHELIRRSHLASHLLFFVSQQLFPGVRFGPSPLTQALSTLIANKASEIGDLCRWELNEPPAAE